MAAADRQGTVHSNLVEDTEPVVDTDAAEAHKVAATAVVDAEADADTAETEGIVEDAVAQESLLLVSTLRRNPCDPDSPLGAAFAVSLAGMAS